MVTWHTIKLPRMLRKFSRFHPSKGIIGLTLSKKKKKKSKYINSQLIIYFLS